MRARKGTPTMMVRIYTGDDGQSHFEDVTIPEGDAQVLALESGADMTFMRLLDGHFADWHNALRRQYLFMLAGQQDLQIGDGTVRSLRPGDMLVAEDLTGQGHTSRFVGDSVSVSIPMTD